MKHLFAFLLLASSALHAASVPDLVSYQGRVTDANGVPLGDTAPVNRRVVFSLFDDPDEGNRVWTEIQTVTIAKGEFSVMLGSGIALGTATRPSLGKAFAAAVSSLYLEITVDTGNGQITLENTAEDPPLKPRQRIVTTAFAFRAHSADGITPGSDLRFLDGSNPANSDQGMGLYSSNGNTARVTATAVGGAVTTLTITSGGSGYDTAPAVSIAPPVATVTATATAAVSSGAVTTITINAAGSGYFTAPTVTVTAPSSGTTASATATVSNGVVSAIVLGNAGSGYTTAPTVTIAAPAPPVAATATAAVAGGAVTTVTLTNAGSGYISAPVVSIGPPVNAGTRTFAGAPVNGPVLYGQGGGALGSASGATRNIALNWDASGSVGVGVQPPTERLDIAGNFKASGSLVAAALATPASITASGPLSVGMLSATGNVSGTSIIGSALSLAPSGAALSADGAIYIPKGGTLRGPTDNPLNIDTKGKITIKDLVVTTTFGLPPAAAATIPAVLSTQRRVVIGGATGWGDTILDTPAIPVGGPSAATGMRIILGGSNASSDLIGLGMSDASSPFTLFPSTGSMQWFGGTNEILSIAAPTGTLTSKQINVKGEMRVKGTSSAQLLLTQTNATKADTRDLALTTRSDNTSDLAWIDSDGTTLIPLMSFKNVNYDPQLNDQVANRGYVGVGVPDPKAPLHVKQQAQFQTNSNLVHNADNAQRTSNGIYLGDAGVMTVDGGNGSWGDYQVQRYEHIAALFDGETITNRLWLGTDLDTSSDARAKDILGLSDTARDLDTLMRLQVTDYHWIDQAVDNFRPHKRLVAQQVKSVFPQAVSIAPLPKAIPSVYEKASALKHDATAKTLAITTAKAHGFQSGDLVDLFTETKEMKETKVVAITDANTFVIECAEAPPSLFVYGKRVDDFHTVDYDAVSMLTVSATQELQKRRDALAAENAKLKEQIESEARQLAELDAAQKTDAAKLAALKTMLNQAATIQAASTLAR